MSDTTPFGFGRFVPGFDFLQNLAKGAASGMPAMPAALSGWVAPTMSVEEIDPFRPTYFNQPSTPATP